MGTRCIPPLPLPRLAEIQPGVRAVMARSGGGLPHLVRRCSNVLESNELHSDRILPHIPTKIGISSATPWTPCRTLIWRSRTRSTPAGTRTRSLPRPPGQAYRQYRYSSSTSWAQRVPDPSLMWRPRLVIDRNDSDFVRTPGLSGCMAGRYRNRWAGARPTHSIEKESELFAAFPSLRHNNDHEHGTYGQGGASWAPTRPPARADRCRLGLRYLRQGRFGAYPWRSSLATVVRAGVSRSSSPSTCRRYQAIERCSGDLRGDRGHVLYPRRWEGQRGVTRRRRDACIIANDEICIHPEPKCAMGIAEGSFHPRGNVLMGQPLRHLTHRVRQRARLRLEWTRGHYG